MGPGANMGNQAGGQIEPLIRRGSLIAQKFPQVPGGEDEGSDWLIARARCPTLSLGASVEVAFFFSFTELK